MNGEIKRNYEDYMIQIELTEEDITDYLCEKYDGWVNNSHVNIDDVYEIDNWVTKVSSDELYDIMEELIDYFEKLGATSIDNFYEIKLTKEFFENYEKNLFKEHYEEISKLKIYSTSLDITRCDMTLNDFILDVLIPNRKEYENKEFSLETVMNFN